MPTSSLVFIRGTFRKLRCNDTATKKFALHLRRNDTATKKIALHL
jgi:hypothetical protein